MFEAAISSQFKVAVDNLVISCDQDSDIEEGVRWLDLQSQKNGLSFYEMAYLILYKYHINRVARSWLFKKSDF
jgi:hypothetical protein